MGLLSTTDLAIFSVSLSVQQKPTSLKQCSIKKAIFPWSSGFLANIINRYRKHPSAYLYHTCTCTCTHACTCTCTCLDSCFWVARCCFDCSMAWPLCMPHQDMSYFRFQISFDALHYPSPIHLQIHLQPTTCTSWQNWTACTPLQPTCTCSCQPANERVYAALWSCVLFFFCQ